MTQLSVRRVCDRLPRAVEKEFVRRLAIAVRHRNGDEIAQIGREVDAWVPPTIPPISELSLLEFAALGGLEDSDLERLLQDTAARSVMDLIDLALTCPMGFGTFTSLAFVRAGLRQAARQADPSDVVGRALCRAAEMRLSSELADPRFRERLLYSRQRDRLAREKHEKVLRRRREAAEQ